MGKMSMTKHQFSRHSFETSSTKIGQDQLSCQKSSWVSQQPFIKQGKLDTNLEEDEVRGCCNKPICWRSLDQNSLVASFCDDTTMHGFKYLGQPNRHMSERFFWLISFLLSLALCVYLIYEVWDRYADVPVIVAFQAQEEGLESIPFPAVTICSVNKFTKSRVEEIRRIARQRDHPDYEKSKGHLKFIKSTCNTRQSFAKKFNYAYSRGLVSDDDTGKIEEERQREMIDFLINETTSCDELIRLCVFGEEIQNCSQLFKPIVTDFGKCCVFNMLPLPLLLRNPIRPHHHGNFSHYSNPVLGSHAERYWPLSEIEEWSKWKYKTRGYILKNGLTRPWRQERSGSPYGLSILIDPHTEDYFCPVADSDAVRYMLHTPLEMPHVTEFGSLTDLDKELFVEVQPEVTHADEDIHDIPPAKRHCYFGRNKQLEFFWPYTATNCMDECVAKMQEFECKCTMFYMPRRRKVSICDNDPTSIDHQCVLATKRKVRRFQEECGHCDLLCDRLEYNYETTISTLQNASRLWLDPGNGTKVPPWGHHQMSLVHIFFGSDTTLPKLRKRLYGTTDLVANTGGILGLCLGFSVLSGVEVIYFLTFRTTLKYCKIKKLARRLTRRLSQLTWKKGARHRFINLDPNLVSFFPNGPIMW